MRVFSSWPTTAPATTVAKTARFHHCSRSVGGHHGPPLWWALSCHGVWANRCRGARKVFVAHATLPDGALGTRVSSAAEAVLKLNGMLPHDVSLFSMVAVGDKAHARFDAIERGYVYSVHTQKDPFGGSVDQVHGDIDWARMRRHAVICSRPRTLRRFARLAATKERLCATCAKRCGPRQVPTIGNFRSCRPLLTQHGAGRGRNLAGGGQRQAQPGRPCGHPRFVTEVPLGRACWVAVCS